MREMNFWNETQHLLTLATSNGFNWNRVDHDERERVVYWIEPGVSDVPMDRIEEMVDEWWQDHSRFDYGVSRLPQGPVELEVYNVER